MTTAGDKIMAGVLEALAVARGEQPAARIHHQGHAYVPEAAFSAASELADQRAVAIRRMQDTMSKQAEEWSLSMAAAEARGRLQGIREAADHLGNLGSALYEKADERAATERDDAFAGYVVENCAEAIRALENRT